MRLTTPPVPPDVLEGKLRMVRSEVCIPFTEYLEGEKDF